MVHQIDLVQKLASGQITTEEYNAESMKGVGSLAFNIAFMAVTAGRAGRGKAAVIEEGGESAMARRSPLRDTMGRVGERLSRVGERIGEAIDNYAARTEENVRRAVENGRKGELGVLGEVPKSAESGALASNSDIITSSEMKTLDLSGDWRATQFKGDQKGIVYVLRDTNKGELLKVGKTEVGTFKGRFEKYEAAAQKTNRSLVLDTFTVEKSAGRTVQQIESQIRSQLEAAGHKLPWDNTGQRLGRPGPGVPGTPLPSRNNLRSDYTWQGEDLVRKP